MVLHLTLMMNKSIELGAKGIRVLSSYSIIVHNDASGGLLHWAALGKG